MDKAVDGVSGAPAKSLNCFVVSWKSPSFPVVHVTSHSVLSIYAPDFVPESLSVTRCSYSPYFVPGIGAPTSIIFERILSCRCFYSL